MMLEPLTYGDISGRVSNWILRRALDKINTRRRPMTSININIREIGNGVLLSLEDYGIATLKSDYTDYPAGNGADLFCQRRRRRGCRPRAGRRRVQEGEGRRGGEGAPLASAGDHGPWQDHALG
jgi:hypothetical protein